MPWVSGILSGTATEVLFRPGLRVGQEFLTGGPDRRVAATRSGAYLVRLEAGEYQVLSQGRLLWRIAVPEGDETHPVTTLIQEVYPPPTGRRGVLAGILDFVSRSGDSMSGPLLLHADPGEGDHPLQAATAGYVNRATARYVHAQTAPATEWVVVHNLGRNPSVTVTDLQGEVLDPAIVFDDDLQSLRIYSNTAETGYAYLN